MNTLKNHVLLNTCLLLLPAAGFAQEQTPANPIQPIGVQNVRDPH